MTAQQQLAELNAAIVEHCSGDNYPPLNGIKASSMAFALIRKHGPAIDEVLKEHSEWAATLGQLVVALMQDDLSLAKDIARGIRVEFKTDGSPRAESAALRKLTQEA